MSNPELDLAYQYAQYTHRNIFLTGKAGTGKTTFLRNLQERTRKRMIIVAPTGVAAINAGGVTIHSFFQLAPGLYLPGRGIVGKESKSKYGFSKQKINILRSLDLLVIDEISMVRCDLLDAIDEVLRRYQDRTRPFGGVQLLMIGDLQQLAPVTKEEEWPLLQAAGYYSPYFFGSLALNKTNYTTIELQKVYRQADQTFVSILNEVRDNRMSPLTLQTLNARFKPGFRPREEEGYITLTTHNFQAQDINQMQLTLLSTPAHTFRATIVGDFPDSSYPTDAELTLKVGAQVMFCKNASDHSYYNGKIGHVVQLTSNSVVVRCPDETGGGDPTDILCMAQEWQNTKYKTNERTGEISEEVAGTFSQIPLKTAWAITIHKSQGLTFDRAIINAGRAFSPGQVYVALSRCRTLEGLVLSTPITPDVVSVDPTVVRYNQQMEQCRPTAQTLANDRLQCVFDMLCQLFDFRQLQMNLSDLVRLYDEHLSSSYPRRVQHLKETHALTQVHLVDVGLRFQQQIAQLVPLAPTYEENTQLQERIQKGISYYTAKTAEILQDLVNDGLPEFDNKAIRERMERVFELLKQDFELKMGLFIKCASGFTPEAFWDAKAIASMNPDGKAPVRKGKEKKEKTPAKVAVSEDDDILHPKLFSALRDWRTEKAASMGVPPFTIMHNITLIAIANNLPTNPQALLAIPGIGKKVLSAFGKDLLEIINGYKEKND